MKKGVILATVVFGFRVMAMGGVIITMTNALKF